MSSLSKVLTPELRLKRLAENASNVHVVSTTPLHRYYRSSGQMLQMASTYAEEDDLESSYFMYVKFLTLFLERVRQHPQYAKFSKEEKRVMSGRLNDAMNRSESIKDRLLHKYRSEYEKAVKNESDRLQLIKEEEASRYREDLERYKGEKERRMAEEDELMNEMYEKARLMSIVEEEKRLKRLQEKVDNGSSEVETTKTANPSTTTLTGVPSIPDRTTKPSLSSSSGLRTVQVSRSLLTKFLSVASKNTANNVETCAILGGRLRHNEFRVTHVIVPRQSGTANSCTAHNEEDIFDYQEKHGLITLGWIHTHPSQSAFLSSVDLHTHLPYQLMLAEALAIVCAPSKKETRFLVLTPNHGLNYIANCRESGFHPHPEHPALFEDARHVQMDESGDVELVDLRR